MTASGPSPRLSPASPVSPVLSLCACMCVRISGHARHHACAGSEDEAGLRPDFEGLSAAAAWAAVMDTLRQHETPYHAHGLHLAAVRAALLKQRRLKLPAALLAPFQVHTLLPSASSKGMQGLLQGISRSPSSSITAANSLLDCKDKVC